MKTSNKIPAGSSRQTQKMRSNSTSKQPPKYQIDFADVVARRKATNKRMNVLMGSIDTEIEIIRVRVVDEFVHSPAARRALDPRNVRIPQTPEFLSPVLEGIKPASDPIHSMLKGATQGAMQDAEVTLGRMDPMQLSREREHQISENVHKRRLDAEGNWEIIAGDVSGAILKAWDLLTSSEPPPARPDPGSSSASSPHWGRAIPSDDRSLAMPFFDLCTVEPFSTLYGMAVELDKFSRRDVPFTRTPSDWKSAEGLGFESDDEPHALRGDGLWLTGSWYVEVPKGAREGFLRGLRESPKLEKDVAELGGLFRQRLGEIRDFITNSSWIDPTLPEAGGSIRR